MVETVRRILFQSALAVIDTPVRRAFFGMILSAVGVAIYREISPVRRVWVRHLPSLRIENYP